MRIDNATVRLVARDFVNAYMAHGDNIAKLWHFVTADVRSAIIDSVVMDHIRAAHSSDNEKAHTPAEILDFRGRLLAALAAGVPRGSAGRVHITID